MKTTNNLIEVPVPPIIETAVVVRLVLPTDDPEEVEESLAEIKRLAWTAGARVSTTLLQRRPKPCPATLIGKGKAEELRRLCEELNANIVIIDANLTPSQATNLEEITETKIVDRTQLILDIFAQRAKTLEAKHQVELAQLQYLLPRLTGRGSIMRQQGGIGVRGPGEQKLEVDRRVIRTRIGRLQAELQEIRKQRQIQRKQRKESGVFHVALVGYTNAGKSSLLNALTNANVFVEDKLFATLTTTTRRCRLPSGRTVVFTDTVGFVRKLPHSLVAAFRATLEEVTEAHLLLLVADASDPAAYEQIETVHRVLEEIGASEIPFIRVINKIDVAQPEQVRRLVEFPMNMRKEAASIPISALKGENLPLLLETIDRVLGEYCHRLQLRIPLQEASLLSTLFETSRICSQKYEENEVILEAEVTPALLGKVQRYIVDGAQRRNDSA